MNPTIYWRGPGAYQHASRTIGSNMYGYTHTNEYRRTDDVAEYNERDQQQWSKPSGHMEVPPEGWHVVNI